MHKVVLLFAAVAALGCQRDREFESAGALDTTADTTARIRIPDIDIGTTTDTMSLPTFGTKRDTIIVDRPTVTGRRPVEVKRPTIDGNQKKQP